MYVCVDASVFNVVVRGWINCQRMGGGMSQLSTYGCVDGHLSIFGCVIGSNVNVWGAGMGCSWLGREMTGKMDRYNWAAYVLCK